jgi:hypothetical protein
MNTLRLNTIDGRRKVADLCGVPETTVRGWHQRGGSVPAKYWLRLEEAGLVTVLELAAFAAQTSEAA